MNKARVIALSLSPTHSMVKENVEEVQLIENHGIEGDAHAGATVKHRYLLIKFGKKPNFRQVHLIHEELLDELKSKGFNIAPGEMGENITTRNIDLLTLPTDTILNIGESQIQIKGLRNPCKQLDGIQKGLMKAVIDKDEKGQLIRKAGVMAIVLKGGKIKLKDEIEIVLPDGEFKSLEPV